jgi:kinetochore protein Mis13/DSN1
MTIAVLTASTTRATRREPLKVIDMATSQARPAPSSESANESKRGRRTSARVNGPEDGAEDGKALQTTAKERSTRSAAEKKRKAGQ